MLKAVILGIRDFLKYLYRLLVSLLFVALLLINVAMLSIPAVYNLMSGVFWGAVELVSDSYANRSGTRALSRQELDQIELERRTSRESLQAMSEDQGRLRAENRGLVTQVESARVELRNSRAIEAEAVSRAEELGRQNLTLSSRVNQLDTELQNGRAGQLQIRGEISSISKRMQQRSVRMVVRNTGLIVTDSIPLIGTMAIVGGLAWDVKDTCDQIGDLRELEQAINVFNDSQSDVIDPPWCGMEASDIFKMIYSGESSPEAICVEARLRTRSMDPPECRSISEDRELFPNLINDEIPISPGIDLGFD
ncbi:MAG: hypothetical protein Q7L07_17375 [Pseudohongiella sp.]|nr:hypothetical protein [Pseudohongiella sp.]